LSEEKKIGIVVLWKRNKEFYALTPEKEAELWKEWAEISKRWETKVKLVGAYTAHGMGKFDDLFINEVTDIGDWIAYAEEVVRSALWGKYYEDYEIYTGINGPYFSEATKDMLYFKELARLSK